MKGSLWILWFAYLVLSTRGAMAQYYEEKDDSPSDVRYIAVGVVGRDFAPRSTNSLPDSSAIRYTRVMPVVSFRQGTVELMFGYTTYTLAGATKSSVFLGGRFGTEVLLVGRRTSQLLFPLQLAADYTKSEGIGPSREDFNIASVGVGMGLKYRYHANSVEFSIGIEEFAHYSSDGVGVGSGFSSASVGDAVVLLNNVALLDGIVVGYRFRLQTWAMNETKFNYRSISHGPYLGLMF